jgi:hypothetical protein
MMSLLIDGIVDFFIPNLCLLDANICFGRYCATIVVIKQTGASVACLFLQSLNKRFMLEQQLINAFMKLTAKVGAGDLIRQMIQQVDENGNPRVWSAVEIERAVHFINMHVENFGKAEAIGIVQTLMRKFDIRAEELQGDEHSQAETPGVQGLQ